MHPDMMLLVERLVIAIETMSQDVKNISAYVYDLSCSVSYLVNEKRQEECISVAACDEDVSPASVTCAAGQEVSDERKYSRQCEEAEERSSHIGDLDHEGTSFIEEIKLEEQSEDEVNDDSCDIYGDSSNIDRENAIHMTSTAEEHIKTHQVESAADGSVVHMRTDSEERPYKCSVCEKSFRTRSDLRRHTRVHSGERPYRCNICGKTFTQSGHLTHHKRTHTGEKPYKCILCGKTFGYRSAFAEHMYAHSSQHSSQ